MEHKLSVIMPCYNCESTLREAVESVFVQNLDIPFELVMVNDGSTDNTESLMGELAKEHPEIRLYFHDTNKGGGATRNTAIEKTSGDIIFCLDGDDVLPQGMLSRMCQSLINNEYDGVLFEESRFFFNDTAIINGVAKNNIVGRIIGIEDIFDMTAGFLTTVNFLYKKRSFYQVGGYPTNHGFDTQGFGIKFLGRGLKVAVCPGAYYYHRQNNKKKSYFSRVYENGEYSRNIYLILEDILYLFSSKVQSEIINYDIFKNNSLGKNNLKYFLDRLYENNGDFFIDNYKDFLRADGFEYYFEKHKDGFSVDDLFCLGVYYFSRGEYRKSLECYNKLKHKGINTSLVQYNYLKSKAALDGGINISKIDSVIINDFKKINRKINLDPNIITVILIRIKNYFMKIYEKF